MAGISPEQFADLLGRYREQARERARDTFRRSLDRALRRAVVEFMVGGGSDADVNPPPGPLRIRSGTLRRAVHVLDPKWDGGDLKGGLYVDLAEAPYGRIHELGGTTSAHEIRPVKAKALHWVEHETGEDVFAQLVRHPGSVIPARPFMTPALEAEMDPLIRDIRADLVQFAKELGVSL